MKAATCKGNPQPAVHVLRACLDDMIMLQVRARTSAQEANVEESFILLPLYNLIYAQVYSHARDVCHLLWHNRPGT